jgi:hypothetical protein
MFPPLADPFKRRFGLVVARFRMVHRNIQCRITDVLDVQFRITEVLDVTFANLYVLNRALVENNGYGWAGRSFDDINRQLFEHFQVHLAIGLDVRLDLFSPTASGCSQ